MKILNDITKQRGGHYCHVLEVATVYELETIIEALAAEFIETYEKAEIIDFITSIEVMYYTEEAENKEEENALYNFSLKDCIAEVIDSLSFDDDEDEDEDEEADTIENNPFFS